MGMYAHALHFTPQSSTVVTVGDYWPPLSLHLNRLAINALFLVKAWPKFWSRPSWFSTKSGWKGLIQNDSSTIGNGNQQLSLTIYCNEACLMIPLLISRWLTHWIILAKRRGVPPMNNERHRDSRWWMSSFLLIAFDCKVSLWHLQDMTMTQTKTSTNPWRKNIWVKFGEPILGGWNYTKPPNLWEFFWGCRVFRRMKLHKSTNFWGSPFCSWKGSRFKKRGTLCA